MRIALIAHDNLKPAMVEWAQKNMKLLKGHQLCATGTTGGLLASKVGLKIRRFKSGPLGGDQQIGAQICEGKIDAIIFFWDPLSPHSHDVDVKALLRIAVVYDIPMACNRATANAMLTSRFLATRRPPRRP